MSLELTTVIYDDVTVGDLFLVVRANKKNIADIKEAIDFELAIPDVDEEARYSAYLETIDHPEGFAVRVWLVDVHKVGKFSSFRFDTNFPTDVNFLRAVKGDIIEGFGFGYQARDGHPKEGRVGGYTSSLDAVDGMEDRTEDDELFVTLIFSGPIGAAFGVNLYNWALNYQASTLAGSLPDNIVAL